MIRFTTILLAGLLLLPFNVTTAEAKATSSAPQVHVVKPGDTLYEIGRRHGLTVNELKRLNGLSSSRLKLGQKLALTRATAPPVPQAAKTSAKKKSGTGASQQSVAESPVHVVKRGDSLYTIARRHGLTVNQIKQFNGLSSTRLKPGQRLALSSGTVTTSTKVARQERPATDVHVVRKGDSLYAIARRHGMTVDDLKRINDLTNSRLKIGQRLALASPETEPSPLLLPGDSSMDEVLEMADAAASELEQAAFGFLSTPYRFGGNSRKGIDCSAFVQQVFREVDVKLPRSAREQFRVGAEIERDQLQKGDLIFFRTYAKYPSHVGIYLGEGKMIHASSRSRRVVVTSIDHPYYRQRFIGAKRITLLDAEEPTVSSARGDDATDDEVVDATPPVEIANAIAGGGTIAQVASNSSNTRTVAAAPGAGQKAIETVPASAPPPAN
ncbi:MAG: C40 family peptidase [Desulfuromonadales bacterium]